MFMDDVEEATDMDAYPNRFCSAWTAAQPPVPSAALTRTRQYSRDRTGLCVFGTGRRALDTTGRLDASDLKEQASRRDSNHGIPAIHRV
jgi:hypothetical protein